MRPRVPAGNPGPERGRSAAGTLFRNCERPAIPQEGRRGATPFHHVTGSTRPWGRWDYSCVIAPSRTRKSSRVNFDASTSGERSE